MTKTSTFQEGKPTFLLDVDGVLANFVQGMIDSHSLSISHDEYITWDMHRTLGLSDEAFWYPANCREWWASLPLYPDAHKLHAMLEVRGNVIFATSPNRSADCPSGKVDWLRVRGFLGSESTNYVISPHKQLMAASGAILIDDSKTNVDKYRESGGTALLYPQPWNSVLSEDCNELERLETQIDVLLDNNLGVVS